MWIILKHKQHFQEKFIEAKILPNYQSINLFILYINIFLLIQRIIEQIFQQMRRKFYLVRTHRQYALISYHS